MRQDEEDVRRDVHDEVSFHIESAVRDLMAEGLNEAAARREALRRFGSVERVEDRLQAIGKRRARRRRWREPFRDIGRDVRFALRSLRRRPGYALLMVTILAFGVAVDAAVFRVVDGALLRPLPFRDGDRLVRLFEGDGSDRTPLSWPEYQDRAREADFLEGTAAADRSGVTLRRGDGEPAAVTAGWITGDYLGVVGVSPVAGRGITDEDVARGEHVAMLDESMWRTEFGGDPGVLGSTVWIDDVAYVIAGIMPSSARIPVQFADAQIWLPFVERGYMIRSTHFLRAVGRLARGMTLERASAEAERLGRSFARAGLGDHGMGMVGVRELIVAPSRRILRVLMGAVAFVLLIVCANLTNLFVAQTMGRTREFAVRASLGAGRFRIVRQVATEGMVVGLAGGVLGVLLSAGLTRGVAVATGQAAVLVASGSFDVRVVAAALLLSLLAGAAIGLWPALRAAGRSARASLASGTRTVGDRETWVRRRWLVGAEVAFTVVLVTGAGLMVRSVVRLLDEDPGFQPAGVLTLNIGLPDSRYADDEARSGFYERLLDAIRALPGVQAAGAVTALPLSGSDTNGSLVIVGSALPDSMQPVAKKRVVTPGYFEALGIPLLEGRTFNAVDRAGGPDVVVVSEALARKYFPDGAIGRFVRFSWGPGEEQEIVGVVGDVKHDGLDQASFETIYRPLSHFAMSWLTLVVRAPGDPQSLAPAIRAIVASMDPRLPVTGVRTMEQVIAQSIGDRRTLMRLLAGFAGLALLLAALGVYAVTAQAVQQRTREIGVRMAVGARARDVLRMVVGEEMVAIVLGLVLGLIGSIAATRVLQASLFGVTARDPTTLTTAAVLIVSAALLAIVLPALRAARTDPADALRTST